MHVTFATCLAKPDISASDRVLADALEQHGVQVDGVPWNGPCDEFRDTDGVIIRTTWDYFDHYPEFCQWLDELEQHNVRVLNSVPVLRWNIHKRYLFELNNAGAPVLPMVAVEPKINSIQHAAQQNGWDRAVLKCLVSGTARGLTLFDADSETQIDEALKVAKPWLEFGLVVQPYMPQITDSGELSMVFIDGEFSHAVCKMPKANEFRIQSEFGGQYSRVQPDELSLQAARICLDIAERLLKEAPLYARVDGLLANDRFQLMELELAEPELMFNLAPEAATAMASAVLQRWS